MSPIGRVLREEPTLWNKLMPGVLHMNSDGQWRLRDSIPALIRSVMEKSGSSSKVLIFVCAHLFVANSC